jgi:hypothetical protein
LALVHLDNYVLREGQGSKSFDKAKDFVLAIQKRLTFYCKKLPIRLFYIYKKKAGVDAVQVLILGRNVVPVD